MGAALTITAVGSAAQADADKNLEVSAASSAACEARLGDLVAPEAVVTDHSSSITDPFWIGSFAPFRCPLLIDGVERPVQISAATRPDIKRLSAPDEDIGAITVLDKRDTQIIVAADDPTKVRARHLRKINGIPVLFEASPSTLPAAHSVLDAMKRFDLGSLKIERSWKKHAGQFSRLDSIDGAPGFYRFSRANEPFRYGVVSDAGKILIAPEFELITATARGFIVRTKNDSQWGLYALDGEVILPAEYRTISDQGEDRALIYHLDGNEQVYDVNSRSFLGGKHESIDFVDGRDLVIVHDEGEYRLMTRDMIPAIEGAFSRVMKVRDNRLIVGIDGKEGLIDENWEYLIPAEFNRLWPHSKHGLLYGRRDDAQMYFDYDGRALTPPGWSAHYAPSDEKGYLTVSDPSGRFGILKKDGNVLIEPKFSQAFQFREGYLPAAIPGADGTQNGQRFGLVDESGTVVIPFEYEVLQLVFDGRLWAKRDGKWGLINTDQSIVTEFTIDEISRHRKQYDRETRSDIRLMVAQRDGHYGIVRHDTGATVVPFEYDAGRAATLELRKGDEWLSYPCGFGLGGDQCGSRPGVIRTAPARRPKD
ncbi:hypothetical protein GCM10009096_28800 [Parasphingorhabdus litoris]|uniref:WG repeat-containing protein n=1 Tax=Parasphingorhabdus litoris TaxID=394733 RepID=A0ABN1AVY8_9SPHN